MNELNLTVHLFYIQVDSQSLLPKKRMSFQVDVVLYQQIQRFVSKFIGKNFGYLVLYVFENNNICVMYQVYTNVAKKILMLYIFVTDKARYFEYAVHLFTFDLEVTLSTIYNRLRAPRQRTRLARHFFFWHNGLIFTCTQFCLYGTQTWYYFVRINLNLFCTSVQDQMFIVEKIFLVILTMMGMLLPQKLYKYVVSYLCNSVGQGLQKSLQFNYIVGLRLQLHNKFKDFIKFNRPRLKKTYCQRIIKLYVFKDKMYLGHIFVCNINIKNLSNRQVVKIFSKLCLLKICFNGGSFDQFHLIKKIKFHFIKKFFYRK
eukprot:TRINITY_DN8623_c0_g1_i3.p1 TRINITY_DN8623_c0_g1~~TRINITY_DN8623_c0_g1_i3.p1  ORF type:complete len:323 (-),score=-28.73 TRINITY_DN8623_c0_g1_i3:114-1058(-)